MLSLFEEYPMVTVMAIISAVTMVFIICGAELSLENFLLSW